MLCYLPLRIKVALASEQIGSPNLFQLLKLKSGDATRETVRD